MTHPTISRLLDRGLYDLLHHVCELRGVTPEEVCGTRRMRHVVAARHELWAMLRHHPSCRYSYPAIALMFDVADHTSIMHGVRKWQPSELTYPSLVSSTRHEELNRPWMADGLGWQT
jgi:chromosomal replication initiation ATPase DnaA